MTPRQAVESGDADRRERGESTFARSPYPAARDGRADARSLYGEPQHEEVCERAELNEAFYGEPQHEDLDEFLGAEPFPWLLEEADERDRRPPTRSRAELPIRRVRRERRRTRRQ